MNEGAARKPSPWRQAVRRPFWWIDSGLDWFERSVLVIGIGSMAVVSVVNVISRNTLGSSLQFANDVTQLLLVLVTFMGIGIGAREARHIRVSAIHDLLPTFARKILLTIVGFGTSALMFLLAGYAWQYVESTRRSCRILPEAVGSVPLWLGVVVILLAMVLGGHLLRLVAERGGRMLSKMPPVRRNLMLSIAVIVALAAAALVFGLFIELVENRTGRCRVTSSTGFPVYLIYTVAPLGFFLGGVQFALAGLRNVLSRDNYLSWYRLDEYEDEGQAAEQASLGRSTGADEAGGDPGGDRDHD